MNEDSNSVFRADCPSRLLLDELADKWAVLVLAALSEGPLRFSALRRRLDVSQKMLTQTLRRLERCGIVSRAVLNTSPIAVEYTITPLGRTLGKPFSALYNWTIAHLDDVEAAKKRYDKYRSE
jgi:DNA-binding HxlR family transcriptional regulator